MDSAAYDIALMLHLLGALGFVAGIVLAGAGFEAARRRRRPAEIALLLSLTRVGVLLVAVGTLLIAAFGLWLVQLGSWGYGSGWVTPRSACTSRRSRSSIAESASGCSFRQLSRIVPPLR